MSSRKKIKIPVRDRLRSQSSYLLVPNTVTIAALCVGLSAVRFASVQSWDFAIGAIIFAAILDTLDGRLARLLKSTSDFGAELDSLVDFVNFGVVPGLLIYNFSLYNLGKLGWGMCLFYIICCGLRLARFNVSRIAAAAYLASNPTEATKQQYFVGVPAPAGAILAITPIIMDLEFGFDSSRLKVGLCIIASLAAGTLMISRLRTLSLKGITVSPKRIIPSLALIGIVMALFIGAPWLMMLGVVGLYVLSLFLTPFCLSNKTPTTEPSNRGESS